MFQIINIIGIVFDQTQCYIRSTLCLYNRCVHLKQHATPHTLEKARCASALFDLFASFASASLSISSINVFGAVIFLIAAISATLDRVTTCATISGRKAAIHNSNDLRPSVTCY